MWVGPAGDALRAGGDKLAAKRIARRRACRSSGGRAGGARLPAGREGGRRRRRPRDARRPRARRARGRARGRAARGGGGVRRRPRLLRALRRAAAPRRDPGARRRARHVVALGERECSIQRRHQKVLEESPSPALDPACARGWATPRSRFARAVGYRAPARPSSCSTGRDFFFLELNGRIQVEHPVTELVTGVDLVAEQLRDRARASRSTLRADAAGHAVEVRLYAEDPRTFLPAGRAASSGCGCRRGSASTPASRRATRSASPTTR